MLNICPKCGSFDFVKSGFVKEKQRYCCKGCGCNFTFNNKGVPAGVKRMAIHLYLEGLGFRAISRITGISDVAIAKWINPIKTNLEPIRKQEIKLQEMHKLEHFFVTKEMFNQFGWLLIGMEENENIGLLGSHSVGNCRLVGGRQ